MQFRKCHHCGDEYIVGLYKAHILTAHQPRPLDPNRVFSCAHCGGQYAASAKVEHLRGLQHREWQLLNSSIDLIPIAQAYVRGDRVRDIMDAFDVHPPTIYQAVRVCGVPLRGGSDEAGDDIKRREFLARTIGDRWATVRRLRKQGKDWHEIEGIVAA